jgi:hypothetical protein
MIENSKVIIQIEYECDGLRRVSYGEIDKNKLDEIRIEYKRNENKLDKLHSEKESFICLTNDGEIALIDKEAILSFYELETKLCVYEKHGMGASTFANKKELRIRS